VPALAFAQHFGEADLNDAGRLPVERLLAMNSALGVRLPVVSASKATSLS
jgi:hypothetical protein